jgi:predicted nucleotidyltransferase
MTDELDTLIRKAAEVLKSFGATDVYLFGSVAKGTNTEHSDIDLAVSGIPPDKFYEAMGDTFGAIRREIDIIDLDEKNSFVDYLRAHGELHRVE